MFWQQRSSPVMCRTCQSCLDLCLHRLDFFFESDATHAAPACSIPEGGESTAMALIGERWGVFPRLKQWVSEGRPVWGTCAGMILLSDHALMQKEGGQSLVGGLNVEVR